MCNSHPGDAGKAPAFGAHETQLAATTRKKKKVKNPLERTLKQPEVNRHCAKRQLVSIPTSENPGQKG